MTIDDLHPEDLLAAARQEAAAHGSFSPYASRIEEGDLRAAVFELCVGGRLGEWLLEDQLWSEAGWIDDWLDLMVRCRGAVRQGSGVAVPCAGCGHPLCSGMSEVLRARPIQPDDGVAGAERR